MSLKILPIRKSAEFQKIGKKGQKFYSKTILLISAPTSEIYFQNLLENKNYDDFCRIGYTVSKTVGNAVARNLAKRRLREVLADLKKFAKIRHDYVIIARKEIAKADFAKISNDLKFCLKRIHQIKTPSVKK